MASTPLYFASDQEEQIWKAELRLALRTFDDLLAEGFVRASDRAALTPVLTKYAFVLPRGYAALIDRDDPSCPIRRQAIPSAEELATPRRDYSADPFSDLTHQPTNRITHRYRHRVLLHLTPNCSMYCRFCFRKSLLNEFSDQFIDGGVKEAIAYIQANSDIHEVIFSGGDPFLANETLLADALSLLSEVAHLKWIRFHTRVPVTLPSRITTQFVETLARISLPVTVVTHFNHPKEVTVQTTTACGRLRERGITLLNQSVLLSGVNDEARTLTQLSEKLFEQGVLPYYLHHPDRSTGTQHFDVSLQRGREVYDEMRRTLPGYLVPRYVIDKGNEEFKRGVLETIT